MVTFKPNGRIEFRFLARGARRVQVVGDFTNWHGQPLEMAPGADGWWRVTTDVPVGEHRFRVLVALLRQQHLLGLLVDPVVARAGLGLLARQERSFKGQTICCRRRRESGRTRRSDSA